MDSNDPLDNGIAGVRRYELTNHLGNVLATISDKKIGNDSSRVANYYVAEVLSQNDYYPFGMQMPGRSYNAGSGYRYGFNGKEQDNEVKGEGNQIDYGDRTYDPRISRFLSVDPLSKKYPWYTPYQFAGNTPLQAIDLDGREEYHYTLTQNNGQAVLKLNSIKYENEHSFLGLFKWRTKIEDKRYVVDFNKNIYKIGYVFSSPQNANADARFLFQAWLQNPYPSTLENWFYSEKQLEKYNRLDFIERARDQILNILTLQLIEHPLRYALGKNDQDWRFTERKFNDALDEAFKKTGVDKSEFEVTQWAKDKYGKSIPVEYRAKNGAEVSVDFAHENNGPDAPHVGWQTPGKRGAGGGQRGHIILDEVPAGRTSTK